MDDRQKRRPFERSRPIRALIAAIIVIVGLVLILVGNVPSLQGVTLLGVNVGSQLSNIGFTFLLIAASQWVFDNRFREVFFRDIREEVRAAESIRDSGLVEVCPDSRNVDHSELIRKAEMVEIGIAFSDRLIKDNSQLLMKRKELLLRVFFADAEDPELVSALAYMVRKNPQHVTSSAAVLQTFLDDIEASGTAVQRIPVRSVSHYSFIRFDGKQTFLTPSTFSSRRANVPAFHLVPHSLLWQLVQDDIEAAEEAITCQPSSDESSTPWWKSLARTLSIRRSKRGGRPPKPPR